MERNESEKRLVSTIGRIVMWRRSNNQNVIEKNVNALNLRIQRSYEKNLRKG